MKFSSSGYACRGQVDRYKLKAKAWMIGNDGQRYDAVVENTQTFYC
jgi:hypothetical protein